MRCARSSTRFRPRFRLGLVAFAGDAQVLVPPDAPADTRARARSPRSNSSSRPRSARESSRRSARSRTRRSTRAGDRPLVSCSCPTAPPTRDARTPRPCGGGEEEGRAGLDDRVRHRFRHRGGPGRSGAGSRRPRSVAQDRRRHRRAFRLGRHRAGPAQDLRRSREPPRRGHPPAARSRRGSSVPRCCSASPRPARRSSGRRCLILRRSASRDTRLAAVRSLASSSLAPLDSSPRCGPAFCARSLRAGIPGLRPFARWRAPRSLRSTRRRVPDRPPRSLPASRDTRLAAVRSLASSSLARRLVAALPCARSLRAGIPGSRPFARWRAPRSLRRLVAACLTGPSRSLPASRDTRLAAVRSLASSSLAPLDSSHAPRPAFALAPCEPGYPARGRSLAGELLARSARLVAAPLLCARSLRAGIPGSRPFARWRAPRSLRSTHHRADLPLRSLPREPRYPARGRSLAGELLARSARLVAAFAGPLLRRSKQASSQARRTRRTKRRRSDVSSPASERPRRRYPAPQRTSE